MKEWTLVDQHELPHRQFSIFQITLRNGTQSCNICIAILDKIDVRRIGAKPSLQLFKAVDRVITTFSETHGIGVVRPRQHHVMQIRLKLKAIGLADPFPRPRPRIRDHFSQLEQTVACDLFSASLHCLKQSVEVGKIG